MSRFILFVMVVGCLFFLYNFLKYQSRRVVVRVKKAEEERQTGAKGTLVRDAKTGEYYVENNRF